jgi:Flp pilus assembly protein TadD
MLLHGPRLRHYGSPPVCTGCDRVTDGNEDFFVRLLKSLVLALAVAAIAKGQPGDGDVRTKAHVHYRQASQAFVERRFETAIEKLRMSLALEPRQLGAVRLLGLTYQLTADFVAAQEQFEQACRLAPRDAESWFYLGRVYYLQNFFDRALSALNTAAKHAPDDPRVRECLGLTLEASGDTAGAEREFQHAIRSLRSKRAAGTPYLNYGSLLLKLNRREESEQMLMRAVDEMPESWQAHFELAKLFLQTDRLEAALKELRAALACERTEEDTRRTNGLLAIVYSRLGRDAEARSAAAAAQQQ